MRNKKKAIFNTIFLILIFSITVYMVFKGEDLGEIIHTVRQADPAYRKIPAIHAPLLAMRAPRERRNTREHPRMEMRGMPHHPRPRLQRGPEHTRRGRACRVAKRARRQCKTPSRHGGTKQQSEKREPPAPHRCRNPDALAPGGSQCHLGALLRYLRGVNSLPPQMPCNGYPQI